MKKLLFCAFWISIINISSAQISRENWLLGGNLSYSYAKPKQSTVGIINAGELDAAVNAGYFFVNKLAAGIRFSAQGSKTKVRFPDSTINSLRQRTFGFGPFLRYYVLAPEKKINLFGDAALSFGVSSGNSVYYRKSWTSSLGLGAVVFFGRNLGLEGLVSYDHISYLRASNNLNSVQLKIGLQAYF